MSFYSEIANATGESFETIRHMGFQEIVINKAEVKEVSKSALNVPAIQRYSSAIKDIVNPKQPVKLLNNLYL